MARSRCSFRSCAHPTVPMRSSASPRSEATLRRNSPSASDASATSRTASPASTACASVRSTMAANRPASRRRRSSLAGEDAHFIEGSAERGTLARPEPVRRDDEPTRSRPIGEQPGDGHTEPFEAQPHRALDGRGRGPCPEELGGQAELGPHRHEGGIGLGLLPDASEDERRLTDHRIDDLPPLVESRRASDDLQHADRGAVGDERHGCRASTRRDSEARPGSGARSRTPGDAGPSEGGRSPPGLRPTRSGVGRLVRRGGAPEPWHRPTTRPCGPIRRWR